MTRRPLPRSPALSRARRIRAPMRGTRPIPTARLTAAWRRIVSRAASYRSLALARPVSHWSFRDSVSGPPLRPLAALARAVVTAPDEVLLALGHLPDHGPTVALGPAS